MTWAARSTSSGLSATRGSAPSRRKAAITEAMFAVPVGTIRTSAIAYSTPLVLGTSAEPLDATAWRKARARALNAASAR